MPIVLKLRNSAKMEVIQRLIEIRMLECIFHGRPVNPFTNYMPWKSPGELCLLHTAMRNTFTKGTLVSLKRSVVAIILCIPGMTKGTALTIIGSLNSKGMMRFHSGRNELVALNCLRKMNMIAVISNRSEAHIRIFKLPWIFSFDQLSRMSLKLINDLIKPYLIYISRKVPGPLNRIWLISPH